MTRRVLALALLVALLAAGCGGGRPIAPSRPPPAAVLGEQRIGPRLLDLHIRSAALGTTVSVRLLTPPGWSPQARRRWPVLYLLHGCCDSYQSWSRSTDIEALPELRRVLVVMPEGGAVGFYSDWRGGGPAWESFHVVELRRLLERRYRAAHDPSALAPRLRGVRLFVSAGDGRAGALDPAGTPADPIERVVGRESRAFVDRLHADHIPVRADFYGAGAHAWPYWERELHRALPILLGR